MSLTEKESCDICALSFPKKYCYDIVVFGKERGT